MGNASREQMKMENVGMPSEVGERWGELREKSGTIPSCYGHSFDIFPEGKLPHLTAPFMKINSTLSRIVCQQPSLTATAPSADGCNRQRRVAPSTKPPLPLNKDKQRTRGR